MIRASSIRIRRTFGAVAGLALAGLSAQPLHADLADRLHVLANALAASGTADGHAVRIVYSGPDAGPLEDTLGPGLSQALSGSAVAVAPKAASPSAQDLVLELSSRALTGGWAVTAALHPAENATPLWSRNAQIPVEDLPAGVLAGPEGEDAEAGFDVIPQAPGGPQRRRFHWDLSAGYKAFLPWNSTFQSVAGGRLDGLSLGASFQDLVLLDFDAWHAAVAGQGSLQSLDYAGVALAVVAPLHLGPVTLYAGPGGRFGSITLNDSSLSAGAVSFGNNAFEGVAGIKASVHHVGLDLRYGYDFAASYTGYHTLRLGAYYAFGR